MKNIFLVLLLTISTYSFSQTNCKITYIANEGFLIETANKKILTDALFGGFKAEWCDNPTEEIKLKLENASAPFDNVDIITISHRHSDHFNYTMVISHLLNNQNCIVVCPGQVDSVLATKQNYDKIKNNIIAVTPALNCDTNITVKDVEIRILRLEHSHYYEFDKETNTKINIHRDTENLGFLFKTGGIKIFHCGDTNPMDGEEYKIFNLQNEQIDIALLDRLFMYHVSAKGIEIINNYIKPKYVALMHVEPNKIQKYKDVAGQITDIIPDIFIFEKMMGSKMYSFNK